MLTADESAQKVSTDGLEQLPEVYTTDQLREMINRLVAVLQSMNGVARVLAAAAFASVLAFSARASSPELDVRTARSGSLKSTNNVVTSVSVVPRRFALFIIPLNDYHTPSSSSTPWTGFELKASTNNFSEAVDQEHRITFWCPSHGSGTGSFTSDDADFFVVGDDQTMLQSRDNRAWVRANNTLFAGLLAGARVPNAVAVLVSPDRCKRESDTSWLRDDNDDLIWSYMRVDESGHELNTGGRPLWNPVMPVRWYSKRPSWAQ